MSRNADRVRSLYVDARPPDWLLILAETCDRRGQRKTAALLGVSPTLVNFAVNKTRAVHKLGYLEDKVRQRLMVTEIACPALGGISLDQCLQEQVAPFSAANPLRVQLYRACRNGCPHYKEK